MREVVTIGIVGTKGVATIGELLLKTCEKLGYFAFSQRYNTSQIRDGPVAVKITIDSLQPRQCCDDKIDILLCFSWQKLFARDFPLNQSAFVLSPQVTASKQAENMTGLGLLTGYLGLPHEVLEKVLSEEFQKPEIIENNLEYLRKGFELVEKTNKNFLLGKPEHPAAGISAWDGNKAIAKGAIRAGCRFLAFYPITPSTDIAESAIPDILAKGGMFVQTEDEIAALSTCLGASEAGVKSLDVTSGPGLDLKTETIGLAVMNEVPLVLVDVQRAGPATGLATVTEQSDLWQAVKGGHGDAPRVVLAPCNIEECYRLTIEAFNISEEFRVPVILLSDQWLGQAKALLPEDFLAQKHAIREKSKPCVGDEGFIYQTAASTHNERGRPSADFYLHQQTHQKRQQKLEPLRQRTDLVKIFGPPKAKIGIITWGSTARVVQEVLRKYNPEQNVKVCVPELISPFPAEIIQKFLNGLEKVFFVEMNASGQFYGYLRTELDLPKIQRTYFRPGGLPFLQQEIRDWLEEGLNAK